MPVIELGPGGDAMKDGTSGLSFDEARSTLRARSICLRPFEPYDEDAVWQLMSDPRLARLWRGSGLLPHRDALRSVLWHEVAHQMAVVAPQEPSYLLGFVTLIGLDLRSRHASIAIVMRPEVQQGGLGLAATGLYLEYVFATYDLRKVYGDSISHAYSQFQSLPDDLVKEEGRLRGHHYFDGHYYDQHLLAIYREDWIAVGRPLLERVLRYV